MDRPFSVIPQGESLHPATDFYGLMILRKRWRLQQRSIKITEVFMEKVKDDKMRTLIIGNADSIWVKAFIENVLIPLGHDVCILDDPRIKCRFEEFYQNNAVEIVRISGMDNVILRVPEFRVIYRQLITKEALKRSGSYDNVIVIYVSPFRMELAELVATCKTNVFSCFIGSDLMRSSGPIISELKETLRRVSPCSVCLNRSLKELFQHYFGYNPNVIEFGKNSQFPYIDEAWERGVDLCKANIHKKSLGKITICIGYNANPAQQHLKVLNAINRMPQEIKNRLCLILPMTYGRSEEYISNIKLELEKNGLAGVVLTDFMDKQEMAELWVASDIFIHAQTTDAVSASLLESLYAGSIVLNAKWLHYPEFDDWGIETINFESFQDLEDKLNLILQDTIARNRKYQKVLSKVLSEFASWDTCREKWKVLLQERRSPAL